MPSNRDRYMAHSQVGYDRKERKQSDEKADFEAPVHHEIRGMATRKRAI
jgi:hypothetical protein